MMAAVRFVTPTPFTTASITIGLHFMLIPRTFGKDLTTRIDVEFPLRVVLRHFTRRFEHGGEIVEEERNEK